MGLQQSELSADGFVREIEQAKSMQKVCYGSFDLLSGLDPDGNQVILVAGIDRYAKVLVPKS